MGKPILVTGASGFIGGRLAEYLVRSGRPEVRALVRHFGRAVRLGRLPVTMVPGDVLDSASLAQACRGVDTVFHCAYGTGGEDDERRRVTVDGTEAVLQAALAAGVRSVVHLSTVSVYGNVPRSETPGVVTEDDPRPHTGDVYGDSKIEAEEVAFHYARQRGLHVVILRPAIVYGPWSPPWTLRPLRQLQSGELVLFEGGFGIANHVHVDDVVQAMLLAAAAPAAAGEAFNVAHGSGVTWREFYAPYVALLGVPAPHSISRVEMVARQRSLAALRNPVRLSFSFLGSEHARAMLRGFPGLGAGYRLAAKSLPSSTKVRMLASASEVRALKLNPPTIPAAAQMDFYSARHVYSVDKARRVLGYEPQVDFDTGMTLTGAWARDMGLVG